MAEYPSWWTNRWGDAASATVSPSQREPVYGLVADVVTSPLRPGTFEGVLDEVQGYTQDTNDQRNSASGMRMSGPASLNEVRNQIRFQSQQLDQAVSNGELDPAQGRDMKREVVETLVARLTESREQYDLGNDDVDKLISFFLEDRGESRPGRIWSSLAGVDEKTGLNRTERKWLQAQAEQDSDIAWQEDAQLVPGLRTVARRALEEGEWSEELSSAYAEYQGNPLKNALGEGLEWLDQNLYEPIKENAAAAAIFLDQWGDLKSDLEGSDWKTRWREAREFANDVSFGQAFVDNITQDPDENRRAYSEGFDEAGNPLDQAYFDRRQGSVHNAGSGLTDFAFGWFADPGIVVGKAVRLGRAGALTSRGTRANVAAMSPQMRNRFLHIATTPSDELAAAGQQAKSWKPWEQKALRVRERMNEVRDQVRAGEIDEFGLSKLAAFKDDPIATHFFAEASRVKKVDEAGRLTDEYDDEVFDLAVAAMYGHGGARTKIVEHRDSFRDLMKSTERKIEGLDDDVARLQNDYERGLEFGAQAGADSRAAWQAAWTSKFDLERAVDEKDLLQGELAEYESYNRFRNQFLDSPDSAVLRNMRFSENSRMVAQSFRTSAINQHGVTITRYPRSAFMKRPGNADLTRGSDTIEAAKRYLDQAAKYGNDGIDTLTRVAQGREFGSWEGLKRDIFQRLLSSTDDVQRRRIMADVEDVAIETVATKHNMSAAEALTISTKVKLKRNDLFAAMIRQKEETARATASGEERFTFTWADGEVSETMELPVSVTELANYYVPADLRSLDGLLQVHGDTIRGGLRTAQRSPTELGGEVLEMFNSFWKPAVLLRGGYPIRNVTDGQLRALAVTGSLMTAFNSGRALGIGSVNTGSRLLNAFPRLAGKRGRIPMISQVGQKPTSTVRVRGRDFSAEFAQGQGDVYRSLNSSDLAQRAMYDRDLSDLRGRLGNLRATQAGEEGHPAAWAHVLNERVTKDPIWRKMLAGEDDDAIVRWLDGTTEGRTLKRRIPFRAYDPVRWVDEMRLHLDNYVPDDVLRAKLAADEVIDTADLQRLMDEGRPSPMAIDEASVEMAQGVGPLAEAYGRFIDKAYHFVGTLPEDNLMRNPFFRTQYRQRLQDSSSSIDDSVELTQNQMRALSQDARQFALKQTRRYMFSLADQSDLTHWFRFLSPFLGAQMESIRKWSRIFIERPESFTRLYVNGWADLDDAAWWEAVDQNGLGESDPDHGPLENLRMQVPTSLLKKLDWLVPGNFSETLDVWAPKMEGAEMPPGLTPAEADQWKKATEGHVGFSIPKRSLNVSLQGDPFFIPGAGPLVQVPVGLFAKRYPELADEDSFRGTVYRFLFPTGIPEPIDVILPAAWMQQFRRQLMGIEDPVFTNMADNLFKQEYMAWESGGRQGPAPDPREIVEKAKLTQIYYTLGRFAAPVSFQLQPQAQLFIDTARQYIQEYGFEEGYAKYVQDVGEEAFYFWSSNSQTNVAVPATSEGVRLNKKYRALVEENPDIALAIVGLEAEDAAFNYAAYADQLEAPVSPWDPRKRRVRLPPEESIAKAEQQKGWDEWRQVNNAIAAELAARGLTSTRQAGAEDLAALKRQVADTLKEKYPGWGADRDSFDKSRTYKIVDQFRTVLDSGKSPVRADWEGVAEYIEIHDALAAELDARQAGGGSRSIESQENEDLQILYDTAVMDLQERNLLFADLFNRFLDNHSIVNGSN